jgi:hypothetical protein
MLAKICDNTVLKYPYTIDDLRQEYLNQYFSATDEDSLIYDYYISENSLFYAMSLVKITEIVKPIADHTKVVREQTPQFIGSLWMQVWTVEDATPEEVQDNIAAIINDVKINTQNRLDSFAQTRDYDNVLSACTYATSPVTKFQIEGQYCVDMRSETWNVLYQILSDVQNNVRPMPESYSDIEPELPALTWPN